MSNAINPVRVLPDDVLLKYFSYLEAPVLASCCQVSKDWRRLASNNELWAPVARQMLNGEVPDVPNIKAFLQESESKKLKSNEEVIDRLQAFINRISLGQNARFRCLIRAGARDQAISVIIKGTEDRAYDNAGNFTEFDVTDNCIAINGIGTGSLVAPRSPEYRPKSHNSRIRLDFAGERITTCIVPFRGPFEAELKFPVPTFPEYTDMEHGIRNMMQIKLDQLADQASRKKSVVYITAAGVVALSAYLLNSYLTGNL